MSPRSAAVSMQAVFEQKRRLGAEFRAAASECRRRHRLWPQSKRDLRPVLPGAERRAPAMGVHSWRLLASERQERRARPRGADAECGLRGRDAELRSMRAGDAANHRRADAALHDLSARERSRALVSIHSSSTSPAPPPAVTSLRFWFATRHFPFIRSTLAISGLLQLEPIAMLPAGRILGLDAATARELSPALKHTQSRHENWHRRRRAGIRRIPAAIFRAGPAMEYGVSRSEGPRPFQRHRRSGERRCAGRSRAPTGESRRCHAQARGIPLKK